MDEAARKALVLNLTRGVVLHEEIETTITKAKYVKPLIEKLITKAKKSDLATRRLLLAKLRDKEVVKKLLEEIGPRFEKRNGGYLRIRRTKVRKGDNAQLVKLSLVEKVVVKKDDDEVKNEKKVEGKKKVGKKDDKKEVKEKKETKVKKVEKKK